MVEVNTDIFEELMKKPTLFLDESIFNFSYIPKYFLHRVKELKRLSQLFLGLFKKPQAFSRSVIISGESGVGKTTFVKIFAQQIQSYGEKRDITIVPIYVNCRKERTGYKVLIKIILQFNEKFPRRGYSRQDIYDIIIDVINKTKIHPLIILDDVDFLKDDQSELLYDLTNLETKISLISTVQNSEIFLRANSQHLLNNDVIKLKPYTKSQLFDILKQRIDLGLKENVISEQTLHFLADSLLDHCDVRQGLNTIWKACKIAEKESLSYIPVNILKLGQNDIIPYSKNELLNTMNTHKLLLYYSIIGTVQSDVSLRNDKLILTFSHITIIYHELCKINELSPRSPSQLWYYIQDLKSDGFISVEIISKEVKGRKSVISLPNNNFTHYKKKVQKLLKAVIMRFQDFDVKYLNEGVAEKQFERILKNFNSQETEGNTVL